MESHKKIKTPYFRNRTGSGPEAKIEMMSKRTQIGQIWNAALNLRAWDVTRTGRTDTTNGQFNGHWKITNC